MNNPIISVIVPVYNAEDYLKACIDSVLNQDYPNWRLVLVDDGSKDNSASICHSYKDDRIIYIYKDNGGVSSARNTGLQFIYKCPTGEYFTFIDSDDTLPHNALSSLVNGIIQSHSDIAIGTFCFDYGKTKKKHTCRLCAGEYETRNLIPRFIDDGTLSGFLVGSVCGALYKKDIAKENSIFFDTKIKFNEDGLFNFEYALVAKKLVSIVDHVYNYRQYETSSSSKRSLNNDYNKLIFEHLSCIEWNKKEGRFYQQMSVRNVSLALWDILKYPKKMGFFEGIKYIRKRINEDGVREGLKLIQFNKLNKYKKIFAYLIKYRLSVILYFVVRWIVPLLNSRLRR